MSYEIILTDQHTTETGILTLFLDQQVDIAISAQEARRQVNNWAHLELSSQLRASQPQLIIAADGSAVWRVPLHLTLPTLGDVGAVGFVMVDVQHGLAPLADNAIEEIQHNAQTMAHRFASLPA